MFAFHDPSDLSVWIADKLRSGLDPAELATRTIEAIRENELYVFTHSDWYWEVEERFAAIEASMAKWAAR